MTRSPRGVLALLLVGLAIVGVIYLGIGPGPGFGGVVDWALGRADLVDGFILGQIRAPRLIVALFAGGALALAGATMQAAFRNPLASPDVVGTSAGAAFGGALAIVAGIASSHVLATPLASFGGAVAVTWLVFALAGTHGRFSVASLLLAGIALNTLVGALTSFAVTFTFDSYQANSEVLYWLMGGLEGRTWSHALITAAGFVVFALGIVPRARDLDLLTLGDDSAHSLGVDAPRVRRRLLWLACGLTAATVSNTGGIAFVGLVVPHLARLVVGPSHRVLLPSSALAGALLLVLSDMLCRAVPPDVNLRLGVVTATLGAPYFLFLLARHRRGRTL
ncbi:MAG: iron ABC transporter permease [Planctomycetes bacterium]|nr:iron ABC transporter permease [Planctomycetota bacterium]